jgi:CDP-glucose 4,6-dehydratase
LAKKLYEEPASFSEAFNFSPVENKEITVEEITDCFISMIGKGQYTIGTNKEQLHEAQLLKLDSSKSQKKLQWSPRYDTNDAIKNTATWYSKYLSGADVKKLCTNQINEFLEL